MAKKKQEDHSQRAHAKFSASGSARWINCPGSIPLAEKAPPSPPSPYALEGTRAHECLEYMIENKLSKKAIKIAEKSTKWDEAMVAHAIESAQYVFDRLENEFDDGALLEVESRVDASSFTCDGQFGTNDISIVDEFNKLVVIDYKYGAGVAVNPEENPQLIYYALGKSVEYDHNFDDVELVVLQPRADHPRGPIRSWHTKIDYLVNHWVPKFKAGVERCLEPNAIENLNAGPWCQFCDAMPICPEVSKRQFKQAQIDFEDIDEEGAELKGTPNPKSIAIKNLPNILKACDHIEKYIKSVRSHAYDVIHRGHKLDGFKLVEKQATRKYKNAKTATRIAKKHFGHDAFDMKLKSPAQLEKALKKNKKVAKFLEANTEKKSSGLTLVDEKDKRAPVNPVDRVASEFNDIEENDNDETQGYEFY